MQSHRFRPKSVLDHANVIRNFAVQKVIFSLIAVLATKQAISQNRLTRDVGAGSQGSIATGQVTAVPLIQAETELSAPVPTVEEADQATPLAIPFSTLAVSQAGSQGTSESSSQNAPAPTTPAATKAKPRHHALGVTLAILGTTSLVLGATAYTFGQGDLCKNEKSGGCKEARDAGLVMMPVGAGVAVTGFYLVFHH